MQKDNDNRLKELTEGMQRLCAVANRVVQGSASRIEIDLLLDNLRRLYDVALRLNGDALPEVPAQPEVADSADDDQHRMAIVSTMAAMAAPESEPDKASKAEPPAPVVPAPEPPAKVSPVSQPAPAPAEPAPLPAMEDLEGNDNALLFDEVVIEPEPEPVPAAKPVEPSPAPKPVEPAPAAKPAKPAPAPKPAEPKHESEQPVSGAQASLLDLLQNPSQRTLGERLAATAPAQNNLERRVDDLRTVININDRFSFMSELFHNNIRAYNDFIMALNAISSRDEALALVEQTARHEGWDNGSATVASFHKILDKKFF